MINARHFFETARERETIRRRRLDSQPAPWTDDAIFREWRFTNVHRENDKTTVWFRTEVRNKLCGLLNEAHLLHPTVTPASASWTGVEVVKLRIVEACLIFRWFNRISTGELIKDLLIDGWDIAEANCRLTGVEPLVTGAYMIHSPVGYNKLDGLLLAIEEARRVLPDMVPSWGQSLELAHKDLCSVYNMGQFSAGEVICDLRWTPVLSGADDINTWTVIGPGATKGMGYVLNGNENHWPYGPQWAQDQMIEQMIELLEMSKIEENWPQDWQPWELHEVEMWLCEYAKYHHAMEGKRLKRRYVAGA